MTEEHISQEEFVLFVAGELPQERLPGFERHLAACARCAEALADEADLEVSLWALGRQLPAAPPVVRARPRFLPRPLHAVVAALAAAAAVVVSLRPQEQPAQAPEVVAERPTRDPAAEAEMAAEDRWMADCPDQLNLPQCLSAARRRGMLVPVSDSFEGVPRYQVLSEPWPRGSGHLPRPFAPAVW